MIRIIGLGLDPHRHCPARVIQLIKEADINLTFDPIGNILGFIQEIGGRSESLQHLYPNHMDRKLSYANVSECVMTFARQHERVTYLTYGNPCMLDEPVSNIVRSCRANKIQFEIIPGVGFIEEVFAENNICVDRRGFRVCTARAIVESSVRPQFDELLLIAQPIELGSLNADNFLVVSSSDLAILSTKLLESRKNSAVIITQAKTAHTKRVCARATIEALPFFARAITPLTSIIVLTSDME
jgi:uncharacterized protein YabN with tetrapyrrole methylase and pyrophosphatase domain